LPIWHSRASELIPPNGIDQATGECAAEENSSRKKALHNPPRFRVADASRKPLAFGRLFDNPPVSGEPEAAEHCHRDSHEDL